MKFGDKIRALRLDLGLEQQELGDACGLTNSAISRLERHEREGTAGTALILARFFRPVIEYR